MSYTSASYNLMACGDEEEINLQIFVCAVLVLIIIHRTFSYYRYNIHITGINSFCIFLAALLSYYKFVKFFSINCPKA